MPKREKIKRVRKRTVVLYEGDGLVGIEHRFSVVSLLTILLAVSALLLAGKVMRYESIIADRLSGSMISDYLEHLPADPYTAVSAVVLLITVPLAVMASSSKAYVYTGINGSNTLLNIVLDRKERFREKKNDIGRIRKRGDRVVVEEYTDGSNTFRLIKYINGMKRKRLARRNEKLLAEEIELAMIKDCELFGERVAIMLDMLKIADVSKAEEEAHADYLMIALDAVVNFLRENDGATLEELKKDAEISRLDYRYINKALEYLARAPGGPYIRELDGRLYLSKLLS